MFWHTEELSCAKRDLRRAERRWRKTRLTVHRQIYTTLQDEYRRQLAATKASHFCTVIREAGHNMKTMFGVINALLGRSVPAQLPETSNDVALAETFQQFFVEKITDIRRSIDWCAVTTTTFDRQPCDEYQPAQLCEFLRQQRLQTSDGSFCSHLRNPAPSSRCQRACSKKTSTY